MAATNGDGRLELFHRFGLTGKPLSKILGFLMSIFRAAQVWHDNSFLTLPGYCGRVVEVWLEPDEGGMNLEMPADGREAVGRERRRRRPKNRRTL